MGVLIVRVAPEEIEACSDLLFQLGATAIEERSDEDSCTLVVGFTSDDAALGARSLVVERWPARLESTGDEAAWRDEWLKFIEPIEVAGFIVHAPWHDPAAFTTDAARLSIDPGRAFGSGHHPTTRLALGALAQAVESTSTVLDVGCGTGILSIATAKLGAPTVVGLDLDFDILEVAAANAEANGVAAQVTLRTEPINLDDQFDIVVANIVIGDLVPLMPALASASTDILIVSGFLDDQLDQVMSDIDAAILARTSLDGWSCAILRP